MIERDKLTRLWVENVDPQTKEALRAEALRRFGKPNVSMLLRQLVDECVKGARPPDRAACIDMDSDMERVEVRLPAAAVRELEARAEARFSSRNYYLASLVYTDLGKPQLQVDEVETLRRSNYELAKIGTNLNQIAKAFNLLVRAGGGGKLPEIGKKIASLRGDIKSHTNKVLRVLESRTVVPDGAIAGAKARAKRQR